MDARAPAPPQDDEDEPVEEEPVADEPEPPDVKRDAAPSANLDAGRVERMDAAPPPPAPLDAGDCAGEEHLGLCWYLAPRGVSCALQCASHGGFDSRALSIVGTPSQGGSLSNCSQVMGALGVEATVYRDPGYDLVGLGCFRWSGSVNYWTDSLVTRVSPYNLAALAEIACACAR